MTVGQEVIPEKRCMDQGLDDAAHKTGVPEIDLKINLQLKLS